jgi:hypothetical protein
MSVSPSSASEAFAVSPRARAARASASLVRGVAGRSPSPTFLARMALLATPTLRAVKG